MLGRFVSADTIVPEPGNPQSLNRYAYVTNNPLKYTDPTGHFTKDQIAQHLREQGYTEEQVTDILYRWSTEKQHTDWWNLLREAEPGDCLVGANERRASKWDSLWRGKFLASDEEKLLFQFVAENSIGSDVAAFYSDDPLSSRAHTRIDIILGRKGDQLGLAGDYVFWRGTGIFANGVPNQENLRLKFGKFVGGLGKTGLGAMVMGEGIGAIIVGIGTSPIGWSAVGVGVTMTGFGFFETKDGIDQMIDYFDKLNVANYAEARLENISPYTTP